MEYQEFKNILKKNKLTVKKFSELANTSYNTCNTWSRNNKVPNWVSSWLELYIQNQDLKNDNIDDEEYQELLQLRKAFQVLLSKGKIVN